MEENEQNQKILAEGDISADRDVWQIVGSFNNYANSKESIENLLRALGNNRVQFEPLRERYARIVYKEGGIDQSASRDRKVYFK